MVDSAAALVHPESEVVVVLVVRIKITLSKRGMGPLWGQPSGLEEPALGTL